MYQIVVVPTPDGLKMSLRCLACDADVQTWETFVPLLLVEGWGVAVYMIEHTAKVHS